MKLFDLMVAQGQYTNNEGQEKTRWLKIGTIMTTQAGKKAMKLDCLPLNADWDGWVQMFEPNQDQNNLKTARADAPQQGDGFRPAPQQAPNSGFEDDKIPF